MCAGNENVCYKCSYNLQSIILCIWLYSVDLVTAPSVTYMLLLSVLGLKMSTVLLGTPKMQMRLRQESQLFQIQGGWMLPAALYDDTSHESIFWKERGPWGVFSSFSSTHVHINDHGTKIQANERRHNRQLVSCPDTSLHHTRKSCGRSGTSLREQRMDFHCLQI